MMLDAALPSFVPPNGPPFSMIGAAGVVIPFPGIIDVLGLGVGVPPANIIGNPVAGFFGQDAGLGIWKLDTQINIGTPFVTGNAATANFQIQVAPDTGAAGGYLPGTWETASETGAKPASELVAATASGAGIFRLPMPPAPPATLNYRYIRMVMAVPAATNFTAGTIAAAFMVQGRDDWYSAMRAASNYVVA